MKHEVKNKKNTTTALINNVLDKFYKIDRVYTSETTLTDDNRAKIYVIDFGFYKLHCFTFYVGDLIYVKYRKQGDIFYGMCSLKEFIGKYPNTEVVEVLIYDKRYRLRTIEKINTKGKSYHLCLRDNDNENFYVVDKNVFKLHLKIDKEMCFLIKKYNIELCKKLTYLELEEALKMSVKKSELINTMNNNSISIEAKLVFKYIEKVKHGEVCLSEL